MSSVMKYRKTFVSNSSSSSFIVNILANPLEAMCREDPIFLITDEQRELLLEYGFRYTKLHQPMDLEVRHDDDDIWKSESERVTPAGTKVFDSFKEGEEWSMDFPEMIHRYDLGYHVVCNQDYVLSFLIHKKIPFRSVIHYGHSHMFYDGVSQTCLRVRNFGEEASMYYWKSMPDIQTTFQELEDEPRFQPWEKVPISEYDDCPESWNEELR